MKNKEALRILQGKRVAELHHANTALTSCAFLRAGALLSRGYVEAHGLNQTPQYTDALDKEYGVWNDIFLDGVDIHYRSRKRNLYGPVLFKLDLESVLLAPETSGTLRICRDNPANWKKGQRDSDRYISTPEELQAEYSFGDFGKHLMFRTESGKLPLKPHLIRIEIDAPDRQLAGTAAFDVAAAALKVAAKEGGIKVEIVRYECNEGCRCGANYAAMSATDLKRQFSA